MVIHTNTDGQELLRPLVGIVIEQRCSEIAWYNEYELHEVSKAVLDSSRLPIWLRGGVFHCLVQTLESQLLKFGLKWAPCQNFFLFLTVMLPFCPSSVLWWGLFLFIIPPAHSLAFSVLIWTEILFLFGSPQVRFQPEPLLWVEKSSFLCFALRLAHWQYSGSSPGTQVDLLCAGWNW